MKSSSILLVLLATLSLVFLTSAAYCHGKPGQYYKNEEPVWKEEPQLLRVHKHGKLYQIGDPSLNTSMKLLHVYGNSYQMGFAHGVLLKQEMQIFMPELQRYILEQIDITFPKWVPKFLQQPGKQLTVSAALELTSLITRPWTNKHYYEELQGLADGSGVSYAFLKHFHMIGQITKGHCSMFGAWGTATSNGQTVQLRALDWDFQGPYRKFPLAVVYHPSQQKLGNSWMNIGFVGWIAVISGVNDQKMAVSQIGVTYPDQTFGKESRFGNPFTFLLRDVLQFDKSLDQSIHRMQTTRRTCNLILGVGDGKKGQFRGFQYGHSVLNVVDDKKPLPQNQTWHPAVENTVYWGMDWLCPPFHQRLSELLTKYHGQISAQKTMQQILPSLNSGNLQTVIYDLSHEWVYFAYGHVTQQGKKVNAYLRPYIGVNLRAAFDQKL